MAAYALVIWVILPTWSIFVVVRGLKARATSIVLVASTVVPPLWQLLIFAFGWYSFRRVLSSLQRLRLFL